MASFVRRIVRLRFEVPLAAVLGLAAGFAAIAAPLDAVLAPAARWLLASAALVLLPPVAWFAMRPRRAKVAIAPDLAAEGEDADAIPVVRMRRADRHPDAPVPQPIRASRDLGTPFMAVAGDAPRAAEEARFEEIAATAPDAPVVAASATPAPAEAAIPPQNAEIAPAVDDPVAPPTAEDVASEPAGSPEDAVPVSRDDVAPAAEAPVAIEETVLELTVLAPEPFEAEAAPAIVPIASPPVARPAPSTSGRDSLGAMMERLSRGVERRGGVPPRRTPEGVARQVQPGLRDALATLNRLAERR